MRFWNHLLAFVLRKFWTKCIRCGKPFGGHEPHGINLLFKESGKLVAYRIVCGDCEKKKWLPAAQK